MASLKLERGNYVKNVYTCTDQINDNIVYMLIHPKGYIVIFFSAFTEPLSSLYNSAFPDFRI